MNPQPEPTDRAEVTKLAAAVEEALAGVVPTRYDNPDLPSHKDGVQIGSALPVPQPGIPPQSRAAVDYAVRVLSTGVATALGSGSLSLVLYVSRFADPIVCGIVFGAPIGFAVPIAALCSLAKRGRQIVEAAPPVIHQTYTGPVHQETHVDQRRSITQKNINKR